MVHVKQIFNKIAKVTPNVERRDNRGMSNGEVAHQGDVYLVKVDKKEDIYGIHKMLTPCKIGTATANMQLAPGDTKGSRHILEGSGVTVFAPPKGASPLEGPFIVATEEFSVTHPEHADHLFGEGNYICTYQRDYAQEEIERVRD
jgi:hypothetical protein